MENSIASIRQTQTNQQTGTQNFGEASTIELDNISLHAPLVEKLISPQLMRKNTDMQS